MVLQLNFFKLRFFKFFIVCFFLTSNLCFSNEKNKVCDTLLSVLNLNTSSYKNCLLKKAGEKFSREELNSCKKYYLTEIERLSYVFKNICK